MILILDILPALKDGDSGINGRCRQRRSDTTSSKGRCPFPENVARGVLVPMVHRAAWTAPQTISECDGVVEMSTLSTELGRGEPWVDVMHNRACLCGHMMQRLDEPPKAQVRDLASPQGFHAMQVEGFQHDAVILGAQLVGQLPVKRLAYIGHTLMDTRQMLFGARAVGRTLLCTRQMAIGCGQFAQSFAERLWSVSCGAIAAGEIRRQPKVKACAFTRHGSGDWLRDNETGEVHVQIAEGIAFDRHRLDGAMDITGLGELVHRGANAQPVAAEELPACLFEREGLGSAHFAKARGANTLGGLLGLTIFDVLKEALIALVNTLNDVLDGL